jgi:hypothetical protein
MFITLYAVICLAVADAKTCNTEVVTDQYLSPEFTMGECLGVVGQVSARRFKEEHPLYHSEKWRLARWQCQFGNRPAPRKNDI